MQGSIVTDPVRKTLGPEGAAYTEMEIAVPRSINFDETRFSNYRLRFFDFCGAQAEQYLKAGDKIAVDGRLSTGRYISIDVKDFSTIDPASWPYSNTPTASSTTSTAASGTSERLKDSETPKGQRLAMNSYVSKSQKAVYEAFISGQTIEEIMNDRKIKESTVLSYLATCAYYGAEIDFEFLARKCLLGPINSDRMDINSVHSAIIAVLKSENIENLGDLPVQPVHALLRGEQGGKWFHLQEKTISSVTYSQIATVMAMMARGLGPEDWNTFKVAELLSPGQSSSKPAQEVPPF